MVKGPLCCGEVLCPDAAPSDDIGMLVRNRVGTFHRLCCSSHANSAGMHNADLSCIILEFDPQIQLHFVRELEKNSLLHRPKRMVCLENRIRYLPH